MTDKIDIATLRQLLSYDSETGELVWKYRARSFFKTDRSFLSWNSRYAGKKALTAKRKGYLHGSVNNTQLSAHRAAWAIHCGAFPNGHIDHINGNVTDNKISNLRVVDDAENRKNSKMYQTNSSGFHGVFLAKSGRYHVKIGRKYIGSFQKMSDAIAARKQAEVSEGYHENHGR